MLRIFLIAFCLTSLSTFSVAQINSVQNGDWDDPNTWDCACVPDAFSGQPIIVSNNVTITNDIFLNQVQITSIGLVTINVGVTVTLDEDFASTPLQIDLGGLLVVNGILDGSGLIISPVNVEGSITSTGTIDIPDPSVMFFQAGSTYTHSHSTGGNIPIATWDATSNLLVNGMNAVTPSSPTNLNQSFGNFTWNCPAQGLNNSFHFGGQLTIIQGDLRFINSNNRAIRFNISGAGYTLNIGRDFINEGVALILSQAATSGTTTVVVGRDYSQTGGSLTFRATNNFDVVFEVRRNFSKTVGAFASGSGTGSFSILRFNGGVSQTFIQSGTLIAGINYEINNNTILNLGTSFLTGTNFTLNSGTIGVGSLDAGGAIQLSTTLGNLRVSGARIFQSGTNINYSGAAAQFIGADHPSTSGVNCIISNSNGVSLAANVTIGGNLILTNGNLSLSNHLLTLNGGFTPNSNFLNVQNTSSISIAGTGGFGTLRTTGSTTINNLTINRVSSGTVTLGTDLTIGGTFVQTQGDIILNGRTFTISGPYSRTNGSFSIDASSTIIIDGAGALPGEIAFSGSQILNTLTINRSSSTVGTSSSFTVTNLNLLSGVFNNTGTITMASGGILTRTEGSIINNTPQAVTAYDIVYDIATDISSGSEIPSLPNELRHVTKTGSAILTLSQPITINGNLTLTNGIFNAGSNSIDLKGNFVANSTSTLTNSPFTFSGTTTISGGALIQFGEVNITGSLTPSVNIRIDGDLINNGTLNAGSGAQTTTFGGTTTISGSSVHNFNNITIAGTLVAPSILNIAGNFVFSSGTFTHSGGTVVFNGTSSITGSPQFSNVTIAPGATLNGPANLTLAGNFIVNGTFSPGTGRVTFNGTANQDLNRTAGSAGTVNLFNMTVNKISGTLNIRGTIANTIFRLQNELTIAQAGISNPDIDFDGPLNTGTLVLASTSTRTARINVIPAGIQIIGNLTVERFVQNEDAVRAWRYFAPAVVGATVADWLGEIQITGQFSNPSTGSGINNPNTPSLYRWTETNGGTANNRYEAWPNNITLPASSFSLTNGRGYSVFVRNTGTPTITTRGTLRFGDVGVSLTSTGSEVDAAGFNLIGNPYPAPIDWDLVSLPGGVSNVISMLDNVSNGGLGGGQFVYYTQGGPQIGNFDGIIGSSQAFWVETSVNTTLTFTEAHKASDINPIIIRERQLANVLRINVEGNGRKDETVVYFRDEASDNYDLGFDARKRENTFINLFTYHVKEEGFDKFAINALKNISCSREILIGLEKFEQGTYTFNFTELESFEHSYKFTLIDNFIGSSVSLTDGIYVFQVTENPLSNGNQRFKIIINEVDINAALSVFGDEQCESASASIIINSTESNVSYQAYFNGVAIGEALIGTGASVSLPLLGTDFEPGIYEIPVKAFNSCSEVFLYQKASLIIYEVEEAKITSVGNTLYSNYASGNQWFLNGVQIPGATYQQFEAQASGLYTLSVTTQEGCTTSTDTQFVVTSVEVSNDRTIKVFPNPTQGKLRIEVESVVPVRVRALDITGKEQASSVLNGSGAIKSGELDLTSNADGIYILHIQKGELVHQVKIIKTSK